MRRPTVDNSAWVITAAAVAMLALVLLPSAGLAQAPVSLSLGLGGGSWGGKDYKRATGGMVVDGVARFGLGPVQLGVGFMRSEYKVGGMFQTSTLSGPQTSEYDAVFTNKAYFVEIQKAFALSERFTASLGGRIGRSKELGSFPAFGAQELFGLILGPYKDVTTFGMLYGAVASLGTRATDHILLELRAIAARHSSSNVEVDGVRQNGVTQNGHLLGLELAVEYSF